MWVKKLWELLFSRWLLRCCEDALDLQGTLPTLHANPNETRLKNTCLTEMGNFQYLDCMVELFVRRGHDWFGFWVWVWLPFFNQSQSAVNQNESKHVTKLSYQSSEKKGIP